MRASCIKYVQHRTLLIRGEQVRLRCTVLALLLRQQLIVVLHDRTLQRALNLSGEAIFQVEALSIALC
ncbi:hypothetical protein D3C72_2397790 [compost metagenome]